MNKFWFACSRGSGEPTISVQFAAGRHARLVLLGEDLPEEFSAAAHPDLVEDGLEVITHRVRRDVQLSEDLGRGQSAQDEPRYLALALGQTVSIDDQRRYLRRPCLLEDNSNLSLAVCTS